MPPLGAWGDFLGGAMVKIPWLQGRWHGFNPWSGTKIPHATQCCKKKSMGPAAAAAASAAAAAAAESLQSCPTLCDPTDGSPPGSPVPGILQARTLEWVAIAFSNARK